MKDYDFSVFQNVEISGVNLDVLNADELSVLYIQARYCQTMGQASIPSSSNEQHIIEDYDVWDYELSEDKMARMTALDQNRRFADY